MTEYLVINERLWIEAGKEDHEGNRRFSVFNGCWSGVLNEAKKTFLCDRFPEDIFVLVSLRNAVRGECKPYF